VTGDWVLVTGDREIDYFSFAFCLLPFSVPCSLFPVPFFPNDNGNKNSENP
jgi:hypothetical protein